MAYPFTGIIGQDTLKKALILNLINPRIGGVLISGQKGTGKSTAVRALARITGKRIITLPLSATEDRIAGSIDLEKTLKTGLPVMQEGILGEVHKGILYIDEVNLLPDHLVNMVLCAHESGINRLEREGISFEAPCDFILVGTMNPEEGKLRNQFLMEFGLMVNISSENDPRKRIEIVKSQMAYEADPLAYMESFRQSEEALKDRILRARQCLDQVEIPEEAYYYMVSLCLKANVQGHGGDLILKETARALAAWDERSLVGKADIDEAANYVLLHRMRLKAEEKKEEETARSVAAPSMAKQEEKEHEDHRQPDMDKNEEDPGADQGKGQGERENPNPGQKAGSKKTTTSTIGYAFQVKDFGHIKSRKVKKGSGKRTLAKSQGKRGHYIYSVRNPDTQDLALDATIRAAAPYQRFRDKKGLAIAIRPEDICEKVRQTKYGNLLVFVLDASGSMGARKRMVETKAAILSLLKDAYLKRDTVALVTFRRDKAEVILPPTRSVDRGMKLLEELVTGGKTPLNLGIVKGIQIIESAYRKNPAILPYLIIISDGIGNMSIDKSLKPKEELMRICDRIGEIPWLNSMVLDIERTGPLSQNICPVMAERMGGDYEKLDTIKSASILKAVEELRNSRGQKEIDYKMWDSRDWTE